METRQGTRRARVRVGLGTRALAHPDLAQNTLSGRQRIAEAVLGRDGSVRVADCGGGCHDKVGGRNRRVPGAAPRPDPDGQARRLDRSGVERTLSVRCAKLPPQPEPDVSRDLLRRYSGQGTFVLNYPRENKLGLPKGRAATSLPARMETQTWAILTAVSSGTSS
jgi:hypothetical protein